MDPDAQSPFYTETHAAWRDTLRRWVDREIAPHATAWDEAGEIPRELYGKAAELGLLQLGYPEEFGGLPTDPFMSIVTTQELARPGAGGIPASLMIHGIGAPPIVAVGSPEMKARILPDVLRGNLVRAGPGERALLLGWMDASQPCAERDGVRRRTLRGLISQSAHDGQMALVRL